MGWAVIETVPEYHPEGDPERVSNELVHWIYSDKKVAEEKAVPWKDGAVRVEEVEGTWDAPAKEHKSEDKKEN
jgi:hypothetical protein